LPPRYTWLHLILHLPADGPSAFIANFSSCMFVSVWCWPSFEQTNCSALMLGAFISASFGLVTAMLTKPASASAFQLRYTTVMTLNWQWLSFWGRSITVGNQTVSLSPND
jgi:hypothetical protein